MREDEHWTYLKNAHPPIPVTKTRRVLLYVTQSVPVPKLDILHCHQVSRQKDLLEGGAKIWFVNVVIAFFILQSLFALGRDFFLLYVKLE